MCAHSSLAFRKRRKSKGERRKDQPLIPLEASSLIPYLSGRLLTDLPHNPFYLFFFPFPFHLVPGQWVPNKKKFRYVCVCCADSKHMCYISPRSWESHPRFCFVCLFSLLLRRNEEIWGVHRPGFLLSFTHWQYRTLATVIERYCQFWPLFYHYLIKPISYCGGKLAMLFSR